jgi:hypothetical protein
VNTNVVIKDNQGSTSVYGHGQGNNNSSGGAHGISRPSGKIANQPKHAISIIKVIAHTQETMKTPQQDGAMYVKNAGLGITWRRIAL